MKITIFNNDKIKEEEITDKVIRVKALIINSKKQILLGEAYDTIQFPGGHLEEGEDMNAGLIRELQEETGIVIDSVDNPFFALKHFLKDCPVSGNNRSMEVYYYFIKTDEEYHLDKTNFDDKEKAGDFKLFYWDLKKVKKLLKNNIDKNPINKMITEEMLLALKNLKKIM